MHRYTLALIFALVPFVTTPQDDPAQPAIRGQVFDASGSPLAGVSYWISGFEQRDDGRWTVTFFSGEARIQFTDAEGRFEVPCRADLRYDLDFDLPGKVPAFLQQVEAGAEPRVVMKEGRDVAGRVVQLVDGQERAVPGSVIGLTRPNERGLWFQTSTTSDQDGRFTFPSFLEGEGWQVSCGGARLTLEAEPEESVDDLRIEIAITRGG